MQESGSGTRQRPAKEGGLPAFMREGGPAAPPLPPHRHTSLHRGVLDIKNQGALPCPARARPALLQGWPSIGENKRECFDSNRDLDPESIEKITEMTSECVKGRSRPDQRTSLRNLSFNIHRTGVGRGYTGHIPATGERRSFTLKQVPTCQHACAWHERLAARRKSTHGAARRRICFHARESFLSSHLPV